MALKSSTSELFFLSKAIQRLATLEIIVCIFIRVGSSSRNWHVRVYEADKNGYKIHVHLTSQTKNVINRPTLIFIYLLYQDIKSEQLKTQ